MRRTEPRIVLIAVYLGPLPFYWSLFCKSAGANPGVEFLIFTDQNPAAATPPNVRLIGIDRDAFNGLASERLGFPIRLANARKLCDHKPAYGAIFADYLQQADYWGHMDLDIVWGNIARFMREPIADGFQIISADGKRVSGPFTIYQNIPKIRDLFRNIPNLAAKLNSPVAMDIDEREFDAVLKATPLGFKRRAFYDRTDMSVAACREFIGDDDTHARVAAAVPHSNSTGRRLPALWRSGELWNVLPCGTGGKVRVLNSLFLHLTSKKVFFQIDFDRDLILPRVA